MSANLPAEQTIPDLQAVIEHAILNDPRSLQTAIGPSSLGAGCDRCLITELAKLKPADDLAAWLPTLGRAIHEWLEGVVIRHLMATGTDRYIPEGRICVGQVGGIDIFGNSDLLDVHTGTVVDFKLVGPTTLREVRRHGAKKTYRRQGQLYGKGWTDKGYDVRSVAIWFLPRNGMTVGAGFLHQEDFDYADAEKTLARANAFDAGIRAFGADTVLASAPPHTGEEFSCPDPKAAEKAAKQLEGLLTPTPDASRVGSSAA
jgi:hypothetical protein